MSRAPLESDRLLDRCCDAVPGWLFAFCGLVLLGIVVLTPAWLAQDEAAWRLRVMQAQSIALTQQRERYEAFAAALASDDPVVLERLAMTHLRLSLEGKTPLRVRSVDTETGDIGAWLAVPQPVIGRDVPAYVPPGGRVVRLATGPGRPALLAVGLLCVIGGIGFNPRSSTAVVQRNSPQPSQPKAPPVGYRPRPA